METDREKKNCIYFAFTVRGLCVSEGESFNTERWTCVITAHNHLFLSTDAAVDMVQMNYENVTMATVIDI